MRKTDIVIGETYAMGSPTHIANGKAERVVALPAKAYPVGRETSHRFV